MDAFVEVGTPVAAVDFVPTVIFVVETAVIAYVLETADVDPFACVVIIELVCAVIVEFACAVIYELACAGGVDVFIDAVEAFACCRQHIKNNANVRRRGKVI